MKRTHLKSVTAGLIMAVLLVAGPVAISVEQSPPTPAGIHRPSVPSQEGMSAAATKVLHHIVEARAALHAGTTDRAERELHQALALIDHIKAVRPTTRIANHIWVAEKHLDYQEPHEVALDLIPIEISLADLEDVIIAQRSKQYMDELRAQVGRGDSDATRHALEQLRNSLAQSEIDLPLTSTEQHVNNAFALLAEGKAAEAERALKEAEAGVQFVSLGKSIPLAKARSALWQAMEDYSAGHHDAVKADLTQALKWLEWIKAGADTKTGHEAERLRAEIQELLDLETHKAPTANTKLTGFWHRTVGLVEREAEKLYHGWRDQQSENHLYRQLVDAKLHFFYAEHELFKSGDAESAKEEIDATTGYLREAASVASGARKSRIEALEQEVAALAVLTTTPDAAARSRYEETLAKLRRLVEEK